MVRKHLTQTSIKFCLNNRQIKKIRQNKRIYNKQDNKKVKNLKYKSIYTIEPCLHKKKINKKSRKNHFIKLYASQDCIIISKNQHRLNVIEEKKLNIIYN